ncbi:hypothetical protein BV20DRAFT_250730 [Pilatotrama ljubarskyi]|nr:hypothetical protein BV20DRAFT_250730 [Pilatotrama ljubarskyi]
MPPQVPISYKHGTRETRSHICRLIVGCVPLAWASKNGRPARLRAEGRVPVRLRVGGQRYNPAGPGSWPPRRSAHIRRMDVVELVPRTDPLASCNGIQTTEAYSCLFQTTQKDRRRSKTPSTSVQPLRRPEPVDVHKSRRARPHELPLPS